MKRPAPRVLVATFSLLVAAGTARAEANLVVLSPGDCPSAQAVREALWAIRPDREWSALTATVQVVGDRVQITLGEDREHRREVPAPADCADRANRAALVIAAWSGELPAQDTSAPTLSVPVPPPLPVPAVVASPSAAIFELGASGFYSMAGSSVPGAGIELAWLRRQGWWGVRATVAHQSEKALQVGIGTSRYDRTWIGAALVVQRNRRHFYLSSDWEIVGAYVRARGDGYSQNQSASILKMGVAAEGRAGVQLRAFRIWVGGALYRWLGNETILVDSLSSVGTSTTAPLPRWDVQLGLGAGVMFD